MSDNFGKSLRGRPQVFCDHLHFFFKKNGVAPRTTVAYSFWREIKMPYFANQKRCDTKKLNRKAQNSTVQLCEPKNLVQKCRKKFRTILHL